MSFRYRCYKAFCYTILPVVYLIYLLRVKLGRKETKTFRYRLGLKPQAHQGSGILLHGVSAGEVQLAHAFARALLLKYPAARVYISTITDTGYQWLKMKAKDRIYPLVLPLDVPHLIRRFLEDISPLAIGVFETELWPSLIMEAAKKKIPLFLLNARISDRSFPKYRRFRNWVAMLLKAFAFISVPSARQRTRFLELGASESQIVVSPNLKFGVLAQPGKLPEEIRALVPQTYPVITLASTHEGEEKLLLSKLRSLLDDEKEAFLIVVPRHPERAKALCRVLRQSGWQFGLRSTKRAGKHGLVVDTVGELPYYYALSHVAVMGGSFVPVGGHNFLEALMQATPVVVGPYMNNFQDLLEEFSEDEGVYRSGEETLVTMLNEAMVSGKEKAQKGREKIQKRSGAIFENLQVLEKKLPDVVEKLVS